MCVVVQFAPHGNSELYDDAHLSVVRNLCIFQHYLYASFHFHHIFSCRIFSVNLLHYLRRIFYMR